MKQANPTAEDMFEKAREAFFGTTKTLPKPSASSADFLKPRNEPTSLTDAYAMETLTPRD
jgi:hypothetical protein